MIRNNNDESALSLSKKYLKGEKYKKIVNILKSK